MFACGSLLQASPGSTVVTVCGRGPAPDEVLTEWDRSSGFQAGDDVMASRRQEDARALSVLGASAVWLPFYDSQYHKPMSCSHVAQSLSLVIKTVVPQSIFVPWGLFHSDHRLTSDACLLLRDHYPGCSWYFYEEAMYRRIPGLLQERRVELRRHGIHVRKVHGERQSIQPKWSAVQCYTSQLRALTTPGRPGYDDVFLPEQYWMIHHDGT